MIFVYLPKNNLKGVLLCFLSCFKTQNMILMYDSHEIDNKYTKYFCIFQDIKYCEVLWSNPSKNRVPVLKKHIFFKTYAY